MVDAVVVVAVVFWTDLSLMLVVIIEGGIAAVEDDADAFAFVSAKSNGIVDGWCDMVLLQGGIVFF